MTGAEADRFRQVQMARMIAANYLHQNGYEIPVSYLAKRIAQENQVWTQQAAQRAMGVVMILGGNGDENGAELFKVDPAGSFAGWHATAAGSKFEAAHNYFEKQLKNDSSHFKNLSVNESIDTAIMSLQAALAADFKSEDCEVGLAEKGKKFRVLSNAEVDMRLAAIADRD
eukprot:g6298.t1